MLSDPLVITLLTDVVEEEDNISIVKCLMNGVTTDEEIAEKTEIRLNIVRKILYKLHDEGLASYKRSKDPETQWYTYDWVFEKEEVEKQLVSKSTNMLDKLNTMLEYEENNMFFVCPEKHVRFDFEKASTLDFMCPECGEEVSFEDNSTTITEIKEEIVVCKKAYQSVGSSK
ncbi:transcription factor E [Methanobrevibacter sp. DSM 116169]|uniref:transcription factor E n=1 Tax=Methanobrevibacter sp. DSM 116169 TaxID=3242727 RepID=UPI0038FC987E